MDHEARNHPWTADADQEKTPQTTAIVTAHHNTYQLIVQLIWSIYRNLGAGGFAKFVVVDNNSSDGSQEFLRRLAEEGLIDLIENTRNEYHGPALNQAFDYLSVLQQKGNNPTINAIWVLDSDCVVLRPDTLASATRIINRTRAALVGQPVFDKWSNGTFGLHSLLVDPAKVWRDPISPFEEHGEPSKHLQESCIQAGLRLTPFSFTAEGYIIHLGRGTLAALVNKKETSNRYFEWAKDHFQPHYAGEKSAENNYKEFLADFYRATPDFSVESVINSIKGLNGAGSV
jgi:glycosyltransferase involved in cell wall biosynthesis